MENSLTFGIRPECAQTYFAGRNGAHRIDDDGHEWLLEVLVQHLGGHIDAGQPASVSGMTVIPTDGVLQATLQNNVFFIYFSSFFNQSIQLLTHFLGRLNVGRHVLVSLRLRVHPCLGALDRQRKGVHHHHCVLDDFAQQQSHHLQRAARP